MAAQTCPLLLRLTIQGAAKNVVGVPGRQVVCTASGATAAAPAAALLAGAAAAAVEGLGKDDWVGQAAQQHALFPQELLA